MKKAGGVASKNRRSLRSRVAREGKQPDGVPVRSNTLRGNGGSGCVAQNEKYLCVAPDVKLGRNVKFSQFINLYGCEVGDETKIGAFVEIQKNSKIGSRCKISSHTFICEGVTIEDEVFVGHNVAFVNDSFPRATSSSIRWRR